MSTHRSIATVLFTDIVGSTQHASELGDRSWQDLRHRHHAIVRDELARWGGREVNEAGDGFLAVFDDPAHAIHCATTIRERVRELGLDVRCGIHMGQIERSKDGSLGGITLHVGARVAGHGGAGDVLVSTAVRDAEAGSGFGFEDRGRHDLKGIPGQWRLFAVTDVPEGIAPPARPAWIERLPRGLVAGLIAVVVILGLVGAYVVLQDRGRSFAPSEAIADGASPGLAVLPFQVEGAGLEAMNEGMVSLLSIGLDEVGGLRAISPGTVMARWRERVPGAETPDLATALEVARESGARYALVGSAVSIGPSVRVSATVYEVETGARLGRAQVEGTPDDILPLVDRLGAEVLRVILEGQGELPKIDTAALTTRSPEALMAYLEGEVHYRRFDVEPAREAYTRAVRADSTFALAHVRLASAYRWRPRNWDLAEHHLDRARRNVDRLPAREALIVRATAAGMYGDVDQIEALREAVRTYPDDAEMWFRLGETLLHVSGALASAEEIESTFERAVDLDPGNALYRYHYTEFAWIIHADAALAERRLAAYERVATGDDSALVFRLARDLAFGDSATQRAALERLEDEEGDTVGSVTVTLFHPRLRVNQEVTRRAQERSDVPGSQTWLRFQTLTFYGKGRAILDLADSEGLGRGWPGYLLMSAVALGFPVPEETLAEVVGSTTVDSAAYVPDIYRFGLYAAERGRWADYERAIAELERRAVRRRAEGDSLAGREAARRAQTVRGYGAWKRRGPEAAVAILEDPAQLEETQLGTWWLGRIYRELGRLDDAERVYRSFRFPIGGPSSTHPLFQRELGEIYEAKGEFEKARRAYEYFVEYWRDADPELQPMVEEARQAILRLKPLQRQ